MIVNVNMSSNHRPHWWPGPYAEKNVLEGVYIAGVDAEEVAEFFFEKLHITHDAFLAQLVLCKLDTNLLC